MAETVGTVANIVGAVVNVVNCICSAPTCNYVDGHINFEDDVKELGRILGDLNNRKQDIESIILEVQPGQVVRREVQGWYQHVQNINAEVQAILEKVQRVRWYKRVYLDKLVRKRIDAVKAIHEQGSFTKGLVIERASTNHGILIPVENLAGHTSSEAKIWEYLMGNEVGMIGAVGIGGVGKTTIMKNINNKLLRETKFNKVIWVTVSYPLNVIKLQENIAYAMDGQRLPEGEDKVRRAAALMSIMERVKYVLILDDVWETFSLMDVGIPEPTIHNESKIIITSRKIDVCQSSSCKIVEVKPLSFEDSLNLFLDKVGHGILQNPNLEGILKLIVEECGGLPLAIVVIAQSMKGEDEVDVWTNALTELRECVKTVSGSDGEIFERLKFSYDRLNSSEIQNCFLYCSLFPEDYEFNTAELIEGWINEGLIAGLSTRKAAYRRGYAFLSRLVKNCLLEKIVNWPGDDIIKMHDVVRDMAIKSIGPGVGYMVKAGMKLLEVPDECEWAKDLNKVSLMVNNISKVPLGLSPKCATLSTLMLSNNPNLSEITESFFEGMLQLKVLDLSRNRLEALPNSISNLENLSALRLKDCRRLKYLPSLAKMKALKKLDLNNAWIEVVPQGMEKLISLEHLDLDDCQNLQEIPMQMLSSLSKLQYLVLADQLKLRAKEVETLSKLETLRVRFDGEIKGFNYFVKSKNFQILTDYMICVGEEINRNTIYFNMLYFIVHRVGNRITITKCDITGESILLPNNLHHLCIMECKNMRSSFNKTVMLEKARELKRCYIWGCEEVGCVVDLDSSSCPILGKLEVLNLSDLPGLHVLVKMGGVPTPRSIFSNLKNLEVSRCSRMRKLLPLELLQPLQNLEKLDVRDCERLEEIITSSDSDAASDEFTFPKLILLNLGDLPQLKSICGAKRVVVCDSIKKIWISGCQKLKRIAVQLPLNDNGQPSPPPCLTEIIAHPEWWWKLVVEWDHPNAKKLLQPFMRYHRN